MMSFEMPKYHHPDFTKEQFVNAPDVQYQEAETDGVAPDNYHSTSMYPEYFKITESGDWQKKAVWIRVSFFVMTDIWQLWKPEILKKVTK